MNYGVRGLSISRTYLRKNYKDNGIVRRRASFKFCNRYKSEQEETNARVQFLRKLLAHRKADK